LTVTISVIVQNISEHAEDMIRVHRQPVVADEAFLERIERRGADVAEDDADAPTASGIRPWFCHGHHGRVPNWPDPEGEGGLAVSALAPVAVRDVAVMPAPLRRFVALRDGIYAFFTRGFTPGFMRVFMSRFLPRAGLASPLASRPRALALASLTRMSRLAAFVP
jgi:hypothetical protein